MLNDRYMQIYYQHHLDRHMQFRIIIQPSLASSQLSQKYNF